MIAPLLTLLVGTAQAGDATAGQSTCQSNCMACHGTNADGKGPAAMALQPSPTDFTSGAFWAGKTDAQLKTAIRSGSPGTSMMAFSALSDGDIDNIIAFLRTKAP